MDTLQVPTASTKTSQSPKFKVILLGESGVGKSSIFLRIRDNEFKDGSKTSIGMDSFNRVVKVDNKEVQLSIWDTAGVERFRTLTRNFYRNAQAVLLTFSMDEPSTLFYLSKWEQDAKDFAPAALRFLIGNKADLEALVSSDSMESFASSHSCECAFLTSARTGKGISEVINTVAQRLVAFYAKAKYDLENSWLEESIHVNQGDAHQTKKSVCC